MPNESVYVVDIDKDFTDIIVAVSIQNNTEAQIYSSAMEIFPLLGREKPLFILIDLDVPDVNDFVMHDMLKKSENASIPVFITYSQASEKNLKKYQKLKYQPKDYLFKPISRESIESLFSKYAAPPLEPEPESGFVEDISYASPFGEQSENIDHFEDENDNFLPLMQDEPDETPLPPAPPSSQPAPQKHLIVNGIQDLLTDENDDLMLNLDEVVSSPGSQPPPVKENKDRKIDRELEAQVISLENQNEVLRSENKKFSGFIQTINKNLSEANLEIQRLTLELEKRNYTTDEVFRRVEAEKAIMERKIHILEKHTEQLEDQKSDLTRKHREQEIQLEKLESEKFEFQKQVEELTNRLTDKEREMVARNHKFEVELKKKLDEVLQETEDRLLSEFKRKETHLNNELLQAQNERKDIETDLMNKVEEMSNITSLLEGEKLELKKREENLNRTISVLAEEKVMLSSKIAELENDLSHFNTELLEKENTYKEFIENLKKDADETQSKLDNCKNRLSELSKLFQQAVSLADIDSI